MEIICLFKKILLKNLNFLKFSESPDGNRVIKNILLIIYYDEYN